MSLRVTAIAERDQVPHRVVGGLRPSDNVVNGHAPIGATAFTAPAAVSLQDLGSEPSPLLRLEPFPRRRAVLLLDYMAIQANARLRACLTLSGLGGNDREAGIADDALQNDLRGSSSVAFGAAIAAASATGGVDRLAALQAGYLVTLLSTLRVALARAKLTAPELPDLCLEHGKAATTAVARPLLVGVRPLSALAETLHRAITAGAIAVGLLLASMEARASRERSPALMAGQGNSGNGHGIDCTTGGAPRPL